ncbi:VWA domain-containing protein [Skermania sp. ID1734]|uniref:vWA domain-containing protein n=1 Tax=Skermania sp. ID1734 TaxID=2597516 RepID=UPI00117DCC0E|nr:VWA domain-containing protein [Skermania sp. ID1734]TSE01989.1 VWA domain-containing protein [Skermania sp. ID1734]
MRGAHKIACYFSVIIVLILVGGCGGAPRFARSGGVAPTTSGVIAVGAVPTILVIDASGSMATPDAPGPRIDAAKAAARGLVDQLPDSAKFGLLTYGTGTGSSDAEQAAGCQDVRTLVPFGTLDRGRVNTQLSGLRPSGYTPISLALQRAAAVLPAAEHSAIVLVSDGEDTCGHPPCDVARQLKAQHPGLTISTVGFRTDDPASAALSCVAAATGGLFVVAGNAAQLSARLLATQDIDTANSSLSATGFGGLTIGTRAVVIRNTYSDFPLVAPSGTVTVTWRDCDYTFVDGVLEGIAPRDGGRTIDGLTRGTEVGKATELYGPPMAAASGSNGSGTVTFLADAAHSTAYRMSVSDFSNAGNNVVGTIQSIELCRCVPVVRPQPGYGAWTDEMLVITPQSLGAVKRGMSPAQAQEAAGVSVVVEDGSIEPQTAGSTPNLALLGNVEIHVAPQRISVSMHQALPISKPEIRTAQGFALGASLIELRRIYGSRLRPIASTANSSANFYTVDADGGAIIFGEMTNVYIEGKGDVSSVVSQICSGDAGLTASQCW